LLLLDQGQAINRSKIVQNDGPSNIQGIQISNSSQASAGLDLKVEELKDLAEILATELKDA